MVRLAPRTALLRTASLGLGTSAAAGMCACSRACQDATVRRRKRTASAQHLLKQASSSTSPPLARSAATYGTRTLQSLSAETALLRLLRACTRWPGTRAPNLPSSVMPETAKVNMLKCRSDQPAKNSQVKRLFCRMHAAAMPGMHVGRM